MATDLKVSVRRQIDRLRKDLAVATGHVVALQDEIKRHELVYGMLNGRKKTGETVPAGSFNGWIADAGASRRDDRLECGFRDSTRQFTLETISAHKTASEKPRAYLRQVVVRWSKEGRVKRTGRGMYQKT